MSNPARIDSIDALKTLRIFICNIAQKISVAIDEADFEISRTLDWLKRDRYPYWKNELRKRNDQLVRAKLELKRKQILERAMDGGSHYTDEIKAVAIAQKRYDEADDKLKKAGRWIPELEKESFICHAALQSLSNFVRIDIPNKRTEIDEMIYALEAYVNLASPSVEASEGFVQQNVSGEMLVSANETVNISMPADMEKLCKDLRKQRSQRDITANLATEKLTLYKFKHFKLANEILEILEKNKKNLPTYSQNGKLVFDRSAADSDSIFFEVLPDATNTGVRWYIGIIEPISSEANCICRISDFLVSNPSFKEVLSLPEGWLAILKNSVTEAVFNVDNKLVSSMPPKEKV